MLSIAEVHSAANNKSTPTVSIIQPSTNRDSSFLTLQSAMAVVGTRNESGTHLSAHSWWQMGSTQRANSPTVHVDIVRPLYFAGLCFHKFRDFKCDKQYSKTAVRQISQTIVLSSFSFSATSVTYANMAAH